MKLPLSHELRQDSAPVMKSSQQRKIEEGAIAAFKGARQTKEVEEHAILLWEKSEGGEKNDQDK
jgi:hypothetical protein